MKLSGEEQKKLARLSSCTCPACVKACRLVPGGLVPNDVKPIADFLGISQGELFGNYLVVGYYVGYGTDEEDGCFLRPAKVNANGHPIESTGAKVSWDWAASEDPCIFLKQDRCRIHPVKPWNCRAALACDHEYDGLPPTGEKTNKALANAWVGIDILENYGGKA